MELDACWAKPLLHPKSVRLLYVDYMQRSVGASSTLYQLPPSRGEPFLDEPRLGNQLTSKELPKKNGKHQSYGENFATRFRKGIID